MKNLFKFLQTFSRTDAEDPLAAFRFLVEIDGFARSGFQKVSGLEATIEQLKYREGGNNTTIRKSPGLTEFSDLVLERGQIFSAGVGDKDVYNWYKQGFDVSARTAKSSRTFRRDIEIVQLDKEGNEAARWRLFEAWVAKLKPMSDLDAQGNEHSIETLTIAYEGFLLVQ